MLPDNYQISRLVNRDAKDAKIVISAEEQGLEEKVSTQLHFSKHNKSHSETILNNIVNVLGKNVIEQLSSTDLWLILESAYCHDLGMVITVEMINAALQDGSFLKYFRSVLADPFHEMYK